MGRYRVDTGRYMPAIRKQAAPAQPALDANYVPCEVSVPRGISRNLRDAMLQWRLRHTCHAYGSGPTSGHVCTSALEI